MADIEWMIRGPEIAACNCAYGCPCQFNALPTEGNCRAAVGIEIIEGFFDDVKLDGLRLGGTAAWPGAIHQGHGEVQPIIDRRANDKQREALLAIMGGKHTDPGATFFAVMMSMVDTVHPPVFADIEFEADMAKGTGRFAVKDVVDSSVEPIRNPVTGAVHRPKLVLEGGFEFTEADFASSTVKAGAPIALDWAGRHAHFAMLHWTGHGIVH